jgi:molybdate transport system substrate-binding protein
MPARISALLRLFILTLGLSLTGLLAPACAQPQPLMVYAAASLKNALDDVAKDWTASGHGAVVINYAASSTLAQQIAADAPADLFFSADLDWMDWLQARGKVREGQRRVLLGNELVLITTASSPLTLRLEKGVRLSEALAGGRLAIADPRLVPAGKYGKAALEHLGLWDQVSSALAPTEHVRAVLNFVAWGETPLGIVYRTDLRAEPKVRLLAPFPKGSHPPILYPAAVVTPSRHPEAVAFLTYLASTQAQIRFEQEGFIRMPDQDQKP